MSGFEKGEFEREYENLNKDDSSTETEQQSFLATIKSNMWLIMGNTNAALVNVLVSIPTTLSITMAVNYHAKPDQKINPTLSILTLAFGFFASFLVSGGTELFKTFTASQAFILVMQIKRFGAVCLPWTCLMTGFILFMVVLLQVQKFIKITPNCILAGLKFATGKKIFFYFFKGFFWL